MRSVHSLLFLFASISPAFCQWTTVGGNAQHTGLSNVAAQPLSNIRWQTQVTQDSTEHTGTIFIHFGAPIITAANTVFVPVRKADHTYQIEVHNGATGALKPMSPLATDWVPPTSGWVPSYGPGLSARNRFYYPAAAGIVNYIDTPDTASPTPTIGQLAFYGTPNAAYTDVHISTPIVSDRYGNIFFGFAVEGSGTNAPPGVTSGIARISSTGTGSWVAATDVVGIGPASAHVPINSSPVLSNDHLTLYFGSSTSSGPFLASVNATTLAPVAHVALVDPKSGAPAQVNDNGSASPVVGPDGDVYFGVLDSTCCINNDRGWLLHFNSTLSTLKTPGAFGWDSTPSIVPYALVPGYAGHSSYLIFSKYNNYHGAGTGDGLNKIAILDPNATETDPVTGTTVMLEIKTILGQTLENGGPQVREWCINNAAIDKVKKSAIVNSEDGKLYRWDFASNSFTEQITLTAGIGEAYTPTVIGPDGTAYAINDGYLFAVGN